MLGKIGIVVAAAGLGLYLDKLRAQPTFSIVGKADALAIAAGGLALWFVARK